MINKALFQIVLVVGLLNFNLYRSVQANESLTKKNIIKLLSGNSISGFWNGRPFKQNIHSTGIADVFFNNTIYKIPWKVNQNNKYCEDWSELGWFCSILQIKNNKEIIAVRYKHGKKIESIWWLYPGFIDLE